MTASVLVACFVAMAGSALAARPASPAERAAIKRVALRKCDMPGGCRWAGARVSTANPRYAWANAFGEGLSGMLMRRPSAKSRRFRVIAIQGGGSELCSMWRKHAPARVLRDLRIKGLTASLSTKTCG